MARELRHEKGGNCKIVNCAIPGLRIVDCGIVLFQSGTSDIVDCGLWFFQPWTFKLQYWSLNSNIEAWTSILKFKPQYWSFDLNIKDYVKAKFPHPNGPNVRKTWLSAPGFHATMRLIFAGKRCRQSMWRLPSRRRTICRAGRPLSLCFLLGTEVPLWIQEKLFSWFQQTTFPCHAGGGASLNPIKKCLLVSADHLPLPWQCPRKPHDDSESNPRKQKQTFNFFV